MAMPELHDSARRDRTLFVFIDESGNLDFGPRGTRNFVMAAISTFEPESAASEILGLKYRLLASGLDLPAFHASEDRQWVRDSFLTLLNRLPNSLGHVIFGDKFELSNHLDSAENLFAAFGHLLVKLVIADQTIHDLDGIVVIFDQALPARRRGALTAGIKSLLNELGCPYGLYFHRMSTDLLGQAADYLAWAKYVDVERRELRPWNFLSSDFRPTAMRFTSGPR